MAPPAVKSAIGASSAGYCAADRGRLCKVIVLLNEDRIDEEDPDPWQYDVYVLRKTAVFSFANRVIF